MSHASGIKPNEQLKDTFKNAKINNIRAIKVIISKGNSRSIQSLIYKQNNSS